MLFSCRSVLFLAANCNVDTFVAGMLIALISGDVTTPYAVLHIILMYEQKHVSNATITNRDNVALIFRRVQRRQ